MHIEERGEILILILDATWYSVGIPPASSKPQEPFRNVNQATASEL